MSRGGVRALAWLTVVSTRNHVRRRLARVKDPRYAAALVVGLLYFAWIFNPWARGSNDFALPEELLVLGPMAVVVLVIVWWIWGGYQSALALSPSEVTMLVPAPLTRRQIIQYKLMKAQVGVVFTVLIVSILVLPASLPWYLQFVAVWTLVTTMHFHQIAASLVHAGAFGQGGPGLKRLGVPAVVAALALFAIGWSLREVLPTFRAGDIEGGLRALVAGLQQPVPQLVLLPITALLDPIMAADARAWLAAMPGALAVLALHYLWLMRTDQAFEEAAAEAGRLRAERLAALRAGRSLDAIAEKRPRGGWRRWLRLAPTGAPAVGVLWKNVLAFFGQVRPATFVLAIGGLGALGGVLLIASGSVSETANILAVVCAALFGFATFFGPIAVRADLRRDLESVEYLKTLPLGGRQLVAAEIGASALALAFFQVLLLGVALAAMTLGSAPQSAVTLAIGGALGALVLLAPVNALLVAIQNALALLFPAWSHIGRDQPGGVEHMGRMILTALGTFVATAVAMFLPLLAGLIGWLVMPGSAVPRLLGGAVLASVVVAFEVALLVTWLGAMYDALDPVEAGLLK